MPLTQAEVDRLTAAINGIAADNATAANRLPNLLAAFAAAHPALDLTGLQAAIATLDPDNHFWVESKLHQLAVS